MVKASPTRVIVDFPARNADLYWATRFLAPDPVIFVEHRGTKYLILKTLEFSRGRKEAAVDDVLPQEPLEAVVRKQGLPVTQANIVAAFCRSLKAKAITVPGSMPVALADGLRAAGLTLQILPKPFYPARLIKTAAEVRHLQAAQRMAFQAMAHAEQMLRASRIKSNALVWQGRPLTSEIMHAAIGTFLMQRGYSLPDDVIVAGGIHGTDPHHRGHGVLRPHTAIVVDIFPQDGRTRFFGDCTRTFCKGTPSDALARMYDTVKSAEAWAIKQIRPGVNGRVIHEAIHARFNAAGFPIREANGAKQGFIHGTGHGLGLDIHEEPARINGSDYTLFEHLVITVEPGLYYPAIGGVRIEDVVVVTKTGAKVLGAYPKRLVVE